MPDKLYQRIYLSPHLDDAALSCGGRIYRERQAQRSVLVVTVMAGDPPSETKGSSFAQELHARWDLPKDPNPVATRRAEDVQALSLLEADAWHWEWPDCIYRRHPETKEFLYRSEAALFGPLHPAEEPRIQRLARRMAALPLAPEGHLLLPLTVGGHVDHRLVRRAAEMGSPPSTTLVYYEDYPYAEQEGALTRALEGGPGWKAQVVPLDEEALAAKISAVACYRSQLDTFFTSKKEMGARLRAYAIDASGGQGWAERYWFSTDHR